MDTAMLADVRRHLRCPLCAGALAEASGAGGLPGTLRCDRQHSFDLARQGYVNLLTGRAPAGAETAAMVAARYEFLAAGHFDVITSAVASAASMGSTPRSRSGLVLDVGAGTGHYLAAVLAALPSHHGLALDISTPAVRRAARAHPRAAAAVCDIWRGLPVADGSTDVVLDVFAPRNAPEFRRVLRPDGRLIVVTPRPGHLAELVRLFDLIGVDPAKDRRLDEALGAHFTLEHRGEHTRTLALGLADVGRLIAMGPSAWHVEPSRLAEQLDGTAEPVRVTASVTVGSYRPT